MTETDTDWPPARGTPESRLLAMMLGVAGTQLIGLAAHFGIADLLRDGPKPIGTPAEATSTREQALLQAMRALAALGIFAEPQPRQFVNIPLGDLLRSDDPNSLRGYAVLVSSALMLRGWANLPHAVQTDEGALDDALGMEVYAYLQQNPADAAVFDAAMFSVSGQEAAAPGTLRSMLTLRLPAFCCAQ